MILALGGLNYGDDLLVMDNLILFRPSTDAPVRMILQDVCARFALISDTVRTLMLGFKHLLEALSSLVRSPTSASSVRTSSRSSRCS